MAALLHIGPPLSENHSSLIGDCYDPSLRGRAGI